MQPLLFVGLVLGILSVPYSLMAQAGAALVHDPGVAQLQFLQNIESAKHTINDGRMIANQVEQLRHEAQSLVYQAQNLQGNPLHLLDQITATWERYNSLLQQADGLSYSLSQSVGRFEQAYPPVAGTALGGQVEALVRVSQDLAGQLRTASKDAVKTQSIYEQLCELQRQNSLALSSAQTAVGNLQIAQAQAQQQALTNETLATLAAMQAAQGRVQATETMKRVQEEEAGRASQEHWMRHFAHGGFRGVKEGRGIQLP